MGEETDAKGSKEDKENHNNLDSEQNDQGQGEDKEGLDATNGKQMIEMSKLFHLGVDTKKLLEIFHPNASKMSNVLHFFVCRRPKGKEEKG